MGRNVKLIKAKVQLVVISSRRPKDQLPEQTITTRLNEEDDTVTAMRTIYIDQRTSSGIAELFTSICRRPGGAAVANSLSLEPPADAEVIADAVANVPARLRNNAVAATDATNDDALPVGAEVLV